MEFFFDLKTIFKLADNYLSVNRILLQSAYISLICREFFDLQIIIGSVDRKNFSSTDNALICQLSFDLQIILQSARSFLTYISNISLI